MINVFIDGAEGTTGLRLANRLEERSDITLLRIDPELRKDPAERARLSNAADVVFLCLPDAASREAITGITNPDTIVIDTSTAHRTLDDWAYGLPELSDAHRAKVTASKRIASPGCHASGFIVLTYPLIAADILPADYPFAVHSVTGYSGGGKSLIAKYEDVNRPAGYHAPRQYALGQKHKHQPEMQKIAGTAYPPVFNPIIGDFYAGMVVTVPLNLRLLNKPMDAAGLHEFLAAHYAGQKVIKVRPFGAEAEEEGGMIGADTLAGLDSMEIFVCGHDEQAVLIARYDNLGKGASGAAIQCMNIACGCDEACGLNL